MWIDSQKSLDEGKPEVNWRNQAISLKTPVGGILSDKAMFRQFEDCVRITQCLLRIYALEHVQSFTALCVKRSSRRIGLALKTLVSRRSGRTLSIRQRRGYVNNGTNIFLVLTLPTGNGNGRREPDGERP
jgi:hypothetical protein